MRLIWVKRAFVRGCHVEPGTKTFLRVEGNTTEKIPLLGNNLSEAGSAISKEAGVPAQAVFESGNLLPQG